MQTPEAIETARRAIEICKACRYCDGYCIVFEAMEPHRGFTAADIGYLANLCHNCRNCYYACQYAPPHEFAINLPKSFSEIRMDTYRRYAWPHPPDIIFRRNGVAVATFTALAVAITVTLTLMLRSPSGYFNPHLDQAGFYAIVPWRIMVSVAGAAIGMSLVSLTVSLRRFWRDMGGGRIFNDRVIRVLSTVIYDVLSLLNMGGGEGHGCNDRDESFSRARRYCHHATFYGFMLCSASTIVASVYDHVLNWRAPYPLLSIPVVLGTGGGLCFIVGAAGFGLIKLTGDPSPVSRSMLGSDYAMLGLLLVLAGSGLAVLALRDTAGMSILLAIHLGIVLSFFLLLPYSKLVHGIYRTAALLRAAMEREASK